MFLTDQTDHGAGFADDLHVVQTWGTTYYWGKGGRRGVTGEDDRDIEWNDCNEVNDI